MATLKEKIKKTTDDKGMYDSKDVKKSKLNPP